MLDSIRVIQGGMGVYVSTPFLARAVSTFGQGGVALGTVSGVAGPHVLAHILGKGDPGGHYRRALAHFPFRSVASRILKKYFVEGGVKPTERYRNVPVFSVRPSRDLIELTVVSNFALVWLAKEGHTNLVSINYLEKAQLPHLYSVYGAMLAGVDVVTVGAGIPFQFPPLLLAYASGRPAQYRISVEGPGATPAILEFDPSSFFGVPAPRLKKPLFLPIVSSDSLAGILVNKTPGEIHGFVVETAVAGGHNAAPRGNPKRFNARGEPIYGVKDEVNFEKLRALGIPFWVGGALASPEGLASARARGALGIQAGSIFALAEESGFDPRIGSEVRRRGFRGELDIVTSQASPTGFPFKVVGDLEGSVSDVTVYEKRERVCNAGYLITLYQKPDGTLTSRCSAEPVLKHVHKGGTKEETAGKVCLCNGLLATASLGNPGEPPVVTLGDDVSFLKRLMTTETSTYTAAQALQYLIGGGG